MKVVVGLGNPGRQYAATRHNIGFMVIDRLARELNVAVNKKMCNSLVGQGLIDREKIMLAMPQTFMNLSGQAVGALLNWYKLNPSDLVVVYDDLDLPTGILRIRPSGGSGGHKGMLSIMGVLGTENFTRVRVGIGRPEVVDMETADYVLSRLDPKEIEEALKTAAGAVACIVRDGLEKAMNLYNRR
ncbi:MAG: aminoacyl-tRNA hydrolase [Desulfotomaculaceae bacterium]|nr:aminoacyl-tRNA hydrolase [Desulfotomaculaceae bacterium]